MKILICSDYYHPSLGGLQIVLKEIAERLVKLEHEVTVATTRMDTRKSSVHNGVSIKEFDINGSYVHGIKGNVKEYQDYVINQDYDVILIKAAQGWTIDTLIPVLDRIKTRKVFIPCGFSALYNKHYEDYYKLMPDILRQFDHLIFYASDYRDINFARSHNITNFSIIPNGASEIEFNTKKETGFRERLNINENDFVILTVGTFTGGKGHSELAKAFKEASFKNSATLILNGNQPSITPKLNTTIKVKQYLKMGPRSMIKRLYQDIRKYFEKNIDIDYKWNIIAKEVNSTDNNKKILIANLDRSELIQAFLNSDLFVFASNIEYSPLVLFESAAAGLPFLTVPVGNSKEIIDWTKGGVLCPATIDNNSRTVVNPKILAEEIMKLERDPKKRTMLGKQGRTNWKKRFSWEKITFEYEKVLRGNYN